MNLEQVQATYFILRNMADKHVELELFINHNDKIFSAEFLKLTESNRSVIYETLDYDYDVRPRSLSMRDGVHDGLLWAELASKWHENEHSQYKSAARIFARPDLLLRKLVTFVNENSDSSEKKMPDYTIHNIKFLDGAHLDFLTLENSEFKIVSLAISNN